MSDAVPTINLSHRPHVGSSGPLLGEVSWRATFADRANLDAIALGKVKAWKADREAGELAAVAAVEQLDVAKACGLGHARFQEQTAAVAKLRASLAEHEKRLRERIQNNDDPTESEKRIDAARAEIARGEGRLKILADMVTTQRSAKQAAITEARDASLAAFAAKRSKEETALDALFAELDTVAAKLIARIYVTQAVLTMIPKG